MLKIHYGLRKGTVTNIDSFFRNSFDAEWFNDDLVKQMVLDVDKSEVISPYCINSPVLGQIAPERLSSVTTHLYLSNFFFITASFHDILKETAVITYGKTKKIYYQAQ